MHPDCISHFKDRERNPLLDEQEGLELLQDAVTGIGMILSVMEYSKASRKTWNLVMQEAIDELIATAQNYKGQFENEEGEVKEV